MTETTRPAAKFTAAAANPSWWPRVLDVLARDYPEINDKVWSAAIGENADRLAVDAPMVCTVCRQPVEQGQRTGEWFHADSGNPANCSRTVPVRAMPAEAGQ